MIDQLAPADSRFFLVAGVNHDTVTGLRFEGSEFVYEVSPYGDGTVPLAFATLANIPEKQIARFLEHLHTKGLVARSQRLKHAAVRSFSRWAKEEGMISQDYAQSVRGPRVPSTPPGRSVICRLG